MSLDWDLSKIRDYKEIWVDTHYPDFGKQYPVFEVKCSSGHVIEEVKFEFDSDNGWYTPRPDMDSESEKGLYVARLEAWLETLLTHKMISLGLITKLSSITEGNVETWLERCKMLKEAGCVWEVTTEAGVIDEDLKFEFDYDTRVDFTYDDFDRRIGLSTNCSTLVKKDFAAFVKGITDKKNVAR
jgi:hypothetical protein